MEIAGHNCRPDWQHIYAALTTAASEQISRFGAFSSNRRGGRGGRNCGSAVLHCACCCAWLQTARREFAIAALYFVVAAAAAAECCDVIITSLPTYRGCHSNVIALA